MQCTPAKHVSPNGFVSVHLAVFGVPLSKQRIFSDVHHLEASALTLTGPAGSSLLSPEQGDWVVDKAVDKFVHKLRTGD